jgi:hypothetical protein
LKNSHFSQFQKGKCGGIFNLKNVDFSGPGNGWSPPPPTPKFPIHTPKISPEFPKPHTPKLPTAYPQSLIERIDPFVLRAQTEIISPFNPTGKIKSSPDPESCPGKSPRKVTLSKQCLLWIALSQKMQKNTSDRGRS